MFRPTGTDMQDKYCGNCYDIYLIQSQYTKVAAFGRATSFVVSFVLALNKVNIVAVTTILVLHVGNGPKMNFQGRKITRLGSGVFVIPQYIRFDLFRVPKRYTRVGPELSRLN